MNRVIVLFLVGSLVTGCATKDQQATAEGVGAGAGIGALLGAGIGALAGGGKGAAIGAGIGAALGAASGYAYADHVKQRNAQLAGKEHNLDAQIAYAKSANEDIVKANSQLQKEVADSEQHVNELAAKVQSHQITQAKLQDERNKLSAKVKNAENQLQLASADLGKLKTLRAQQTQSSPELDTQITTLEGQVAQLRNYTNTLASQQQRL